MKESSPRETELSKWTFFHVQRQWGTLGLTLTTNLSLDSALLEHVCAFLSGTHYPSEGGLIVNPLAFLGMAVYGTNRPIDSDWPIPKNKGESDAEIADYLNNNGHNCSTAAYWAALVRIESGAFRDARQLLASTRVPKFVFMITLLGDPEVDSIYESAVKPKLAARGLQVARADEIRRAGLVMDSVTEAIASSRFVVADLTNARPNCYYELGYAHALGKPGILIARANTERHFDVAGYRWLHWKTVANFGPEFEAEVDGVLTQLAGATKGPHPRGRR
jgi:hypothetical protein